MDNEKKLEYLRDELNYLTFCDPDPNTDEIYRIIREIREITEEKPDTAAENRLKARMLYEYRKSKLQRRRRIGKVLMAATLFLAVIISSVPNLIATKAKDFFEVDFTGKGITVRVNGSRDDNDLTRTYKSYDELTNHVKEEIIVPSYVPSGLILDRITDDDTELTIYYTGPAGEWLTMLITFHELEPYGNHAEINGMDVTTAEIEPGQFSARFRYGRYWYEVSGSLGLEEITDTLKGLKPISNSAPNNI